MKIRKVNSTIKRRVLREVSRECRKKKMKSLESYSIFTKPKLSNPVSWENMKEFNTHMKEVVRDYKIRQARESAKKVIIK